MSINLVENSPLGPLTHEWEGERCDDCRQPYADVYHLDDELWELLHERAPGGLLCPSCAVRRALRLSNHVVDKWQDAKGVKL